MISTPFTLSRPLLPGSTLHLRRKEGGRRDFARAGILIRSADFCSLQHLYSAHERHACKWYPVFAFSLFTLICRRFFFADCCSHATVSFLVLSFLQSNLCWSCFQRLTFSEHCKANCHIASSNVQRESCYVCTNVHSKVLPVISISRSIWGEILDRGVDWNDWIIASQWQAAVLSTDLHQLHTLP